MDKSHSKQSQLETLKLKALSWLFVGCSVSLSSPLDFVRIRLQVMPELVKIGRIDSPYQGALDCAKRVFKQ